MRSSLAPCEQRIDFNILTLAFCAVLGQVPEYIKEIVVPYAPSDALRSTDDMLLRKPAGRLKTCSQRCFAFVAASPWNNLPINIRNTFSLAQFECLLKTHLFKEVFGTTTDRPTPLHHLILLVFLTSLGQPVHRGECSNAETSAIGTFYDMI